jgi:uncharacterized BrkB/YihY/UPF0761 family membrane protein
VNDAPEPRADGGFEAGGSPSSVIDGSSRLATVRGRVTARLQRYEKVPVVGVGAALVRRDTEAGGSLMGSAIAFRLFLFFVPLLLVLVGLAGLVGGRLDPDDVAAGVGVSGGVAVQIEQAFEQSGRASWLVMGVGLVGLLVTGRSLGKVLRAASSIAWRLPVRPRASWRVVGSIVGLACCMGLVAVLVNRARTELGLGVATLSVGAAFAIYVVVWTIISLLLPRKTDDPGAVLPGAILVASVLAAMHAVSQFYLPDRFDRASQLYGAIGATVVTLGWFFILGRAIVVSMELDAVVYERYGSITTVVFSLPVLRALPRRSARLRRFFGLEPPPAP